MDNSTIWKIIDTYFRDNPQSLVSHHIESYNDFFKNGIFQIFKEKNPIVLKTRYDKEIDDYRSQCIMYMGGKDGSKIYYGKPVIYDDNNSHYMFPNEARLRNMTYGMTIHYDVEIEFMTILEKGEQPTLIGGSEENLVHENELVDDTYHDGGKPTNYKTLSKEELQNEINAKTDTNNSYSSMNGDMDGGSGNQPIKRKIKRKVAVGLTAKETATLRENTEKTMTAPNVQKYTIVLEKIYLGKFPIMMQSNYCILTGFPKEIRHTMGECRNDVGGYFIIDGKEKTVIPQEKFADNMLYIKSSTDDKYLYSAEIRSVSENVSKPIRTMSVKIVAPSKMMTYKNIVVVIPNVRKPVPLFILFRALGIISDKDIITMCLLDLDKYESMIDYFAPSIHDAGGIMTQRIALKYIGSLTKGKTINHALEILADYFLPHIGELNFMEKSYYLGYIVFRLLNVYNGTESPTDRDNFKFKRVELVGSLMSDLFREYYTMQSRQIHLAFEEIITYNQGLYENNLSGLVEQNYRTIFNQRIVESGFKKAFKGNWGAQTHTKRIGIIQDLNRLSFNSMMSHLRKTNLPLDSSVKLVGPRVLHSTQWGLFDPIDTPDGANIGLHKHLSISTYVSQGVSREPMLKWLREKVNMKLIENCSPIILSRLTKIMVNGYLAGAIEEPIEAIEKIKLFRRNGLIPIYTSATFDIKQNMIYIYTDAGRLCRPIFYRDSETDKMSFDNDFIKKKLEDDENISWIDLTTGFNKKKIDNFNPNDYNMYELNELYEGIEIESNPTKLKRFKESKAILDYIDTNESEDALIAMNKEELEKDGRKKYTHLEIHESLIFGMMCNQITFPENNPATRNSFSCGQSKQACSLYHTNHQVRMDKTAVVLVSGQKPLVKTRYLEYINNEENPYGENAIVAIMCYTGYNVEDAILINEGALKRGLFRTTYYSTYESHEEKSKSSNDTIEKLFTNIESESNVVGTKPGYDYSHLDKYGIVLENTEINDKTVLIGITSSSSSSKEMAKVDMSKVPKKGQLGVVDKTFITEGNEGNRIAKVRIREMRIPNLGDKMASRNGQKGTVGLVIPEIDMPFTKDGIKPDLIINPHAIPSRMTIGQLVECIIGKASAIYGGFADCTAFNNKGSKINVFGNILTKVGFHSSGNEILYNGMTGEQLETEIFMGPTYYMRLKHMVKDKINYRALGPRTALTRQPVSGRANDGGLRIGEMERDSVISHGIADFLRESMMERGDKYYMAVCNTTGLLAIYNPSKNLFISPMADGPIKFVGGLDNKTLNIENMTRFGRSFSIVCVPYSFKLLVQELQTINIQMRIITEDNIDQLENMTYSRNIDKLLFENDRTIKSIVDETIVILEKSKKLEKAAPNVIESISSSISSFFESSTPSLPPPSVGSPQFPETSPAYEPTESEKEEIRLRQEQTTSPQYNPLSSATPNSLEEGEIIQGGDNMLYQLGQIVGYVGDIIPNRFWKITNIGHHFYKIETDNTQGLNIEDTIRIVQPGEIYKLEQNTLNSLYGGEPIYNNQESFSNLQNIQQIQNMKGQIPNGYIYGSGSTGMPSVFAPTFKIINGGNDFSSDSNETNGNNSLIPEHDNNTNTNSHEQPGGNGMENNEKKEINTTDNEKNFASSIIDFSKKLFIKKV
jgi:DNA-directed RNA polymerase II subunit RPB2